MCRRVSAYGGDKINMCVHGSCYGAELVILYNTLLIERRKCGIVF